MADKKEVHAPTYDGPERRTNGGRRPGDFIASNIKLVAGALGIVLLIFSAGGGWMAAKIAIDGKVSRAEWEKKNAEQDAERQAFKNALDRQMQVMTNRQDRFENLILQDVVPALKRVENRVGAIYCMNKPAGCQ